MKSLKSTVTASVPKADAARILAQHAEEKRKHPDGWIEFEMPQDVLEKVIWVANATGYSINQTICFLLKSGLPTMAAEIRAKGMRAEWLAKAPKK